MLFIDKLPYCHRCYRNNAPFGNLPCRPMARAIIIWESSGFSNRRKWWHVINHWSVLRRIDPFFCCVWNDVSPPSIEKVKTLKGAIWHSLRDTTSKSKTRPVWSRSTSFVVCRSSVFPELSQERESWFCITDITGDLTGAANSPQARANNRCSISYRCALEPQSLCTFTTGD